LSHSPSGVARIIQFDLSGTVGASGAHGATIVPECVRGYGTKRLISGSFAIDCFFAGRVSRRGIIVHLSWNEAL
jgi:hypothetical protein